MSHAALCPLCDMPMVSGPSIDKHHLVPRSRGGSGLSGQSVHRACHRHIHAAFTNTELQRLYYSWERLREHESIQNYVKWVRKQFKRDPEFIGVSKQKRG